jgi:hypothetical protein
LKEQRVKHVHARVDVAHDHAFASDAKPVDALAATQQICADHHRRIVERSRESHGRTIESQGSHGWLGQHSLQRSNLDLGWNCAWPPKQPSAPGEELEPFVGEPLFELWVQAEGSARTVEHTRLELDNHGEPLGVGSLGRSGTKPRSRSPFG